MIAMYFVVVAQLVATAVSSGSLCHDFGDLSKPELCYRSELFYDQKGMVYIFNGVLNKENNVHVTCLNDTTLNHDLKFETYSEDPKYPILNINVTATIQGTRYVGYTSCDTLADLFSCKEISLWEGNQVPSADAALSMVWRCNLDGLDQCYAMTPTQHRNLCHDDGSPPEKVCYRSELFYDSVNPGLRKLPFQKDYVYVMNGELSNESSVHVTCLNDTTLSHDLKFETYSQDPQTPALNISVSSIIQGTSYVGYTNCDMESDLFYCKDIYLWKDQQGALSDVALYTQWSCDLDGEWLCEEFGGLPLATRSAHRKSGNANIFI